jgi:hypothetical protein
MVVYSGQGAREQTMRILLKIHFGRSVTLLLVWIMLSACNLLLPPDITNTPEILPNQSIGAATLAPSQAGVMVTPTEALASQTGGTAPTTAGSAPNSSGTLAISDRYPLPYISGRDNGLITTPGKVWVGTANGMVEVLDAQSGQVLQSIALFDGSGGMTPKVVFDLKYDGQHVWALASSKKAAKPDTLFVIDAASGTLLQQFDASQWEGELKQKLGLSPGKIWASKQSIDTRTFEVKYDVFPWGDYYAYDGKGWMWITGNWDISDCNPVLWVINADDPTQHYAGWSTNGNGIACGMPITLIGDRIWVAVSLVNSATGLWAYPADGSKMTKESHEPLVMVPSPDDQPIALIGDQDGLWMLAGNQTWGYLYQFDPQTGALLNSMDLVGANQNTFTANIALDDHDLWVLMAKELLRIHLK